MPSILARSCRFDVRPALSEFVILPEVMLVLIYASSIRVWSIWTLLTFRFVPPEEGGPLRIISTSQFAWVSALNGVLLVLLILAGLRSRRSARSLRRGHFAGIVFAAGILILLQVGAIQAYGPIAAQ